MEIPGFQESAFHPLQQTPPKIQRKTFSRSAALQSAPDHIKRVYEGLFRQIDTLELTINYYELETGKRTKPPRDILLNRFTEEERQTLQDKATSLNQYKYLKMRHLLVELRSEQYTYYDLYCGRVMSHGESINNVVVESIPTIGEDIQVAPLGLKYDNDFCARLFGETKLGNFSSAELKKISDILWAKESDITIDFRKDAHILALYQMREDLIEQADRDPSNLYGTAHLLLNTLQFYEDAARLTPLQKDILDMKLCKVSNTRIADYINLEYNKTYNDNYISTIFHKKVIGSIANAARQHREIMENIFYPENFKKCRDCGRVLLMNSDNFVRQKKSSDGFSPRCKQCEKIKRGKRNEANK